MPTYMHILGRCQPIGIIRPPRRALDDLDRASSISVAERSPRLPTVTGMHDSVLIVALEEAKANAEALGSGRRARELRRRIEAVETAVSNVEPPRPKELVVRLTLHALALRDEATTLRTQRHRTRSAILEMMD